MKRILAGILLMAVLVSVTGCAKAENEIDISISPSSQAFIVSNMAPGNSVTNTITITNKGPLDVDGIKISVDLKSFDPANDGSDLSEVLNLQLVYDSYDVTADVATKLGDKVPPLTMKELESGYVLEGINKGESKDLQIMVTFDPYAGNEYQGDSVNVTFKFKATATPVHSRGGGGGAYHRYFAAPTSLAPGDTTPPVITNVSVTLGHSATITWDTNEISDSLVKYGTKSREYTLEEHNTTYVLSHAIRLKELKENSTYYFVVNSTDPSGNAAETPEYIFILTPPSKEETIIKAAFPYLPHFIISWWIALIPIIAALILTFIIYERYKHKEKE